MFKHQLLIAAVLSLFALLLVGCGASESSPTATTVPPAVSALPAPSPTPEGLAHYILGLWELTNDNGMSNWLDFTDDGIVIARGSEFANYEVVNESTIQITYDGDVEIARVVNYQGDSLTLESDGEQATFRRINPVLDLESAILGSWANGDEDTRISYLEFTPNGLFIGAPDPGLGEYRVRSANTIEVPSFLDAEGDLIESFTIQVLAVKDNVLTVYLSPGSTVDYKRIPGYSNLAGRIVGHWLDRNGSEYEFTVDGQVLVEGGSVFRYEVISDTTMLIEGEIIAVIDLTDDMFTIGWYDFANGGNEILQVFTRMNP